MTLPMRSVDLHDSPIERFPSWMEYVPYLQYVLYFFASMKDVRVILCLSLSLQVFLVLVAPLRKSTGKKFLPLIIWSACMLAQWIATFGVALIIQKLGDDGDYYNGDSVFSCWASFLLLHLGYTNDITAFTLETKEWLSHMYRLIFQVVATLYVFVFLELSSLPAILIFIAGVIRNAERTCALYLASRDKFKKPNPDSNHARLTKENQPHTTAESAKKRGGVLDDLEDIQYAYYSYKTCRGLVFDQTYNFKDREPTQMRGFFSSIQAENALRFIEVELKFFSEVLQTKCEFVHSVKGYVCRFLAFGLVATSSLLLHQRKGWYGEISASKYDRRITDSLLICAIFQEVMAFIMVVFSDWTFAALMPDPRLREKNSCISKVKRLVRSILSNFLVLRRPWWYPCECEAKHEVLATPIFFRRWSGSIPTYNLIGYCLKCRPTRIHYHKRDYFSFVIDKIFHLSDFVVNFLSIALHFETAAGIIKKASKWMGKHKAFSWPGVIIAKGIWLLGLIIKCLCFIVRKIFQFLLLDDFWEEMMYVSREPLTKDLWKFIFSELKEYKSQYAGDPRNISQLCSDRRNWILKNRAWESCSRELMPYLAEVSYDHSLLLWHIATELCYNTNNNNEVTDESPDEYGFCRNNYREFGKILSDHMLYLSIRQPKIMSALVGTGGIIFQETCNQAERFFTEKCLGPKQLKRACEQILSMNTATVNEVTSKSVLFDAVNLANKLQTLQRENRVDIWKLLSKVWLEMLSCAAYRCSSREHAQKLSRGGELITFVWFLMAHFGLGVWFQDVRIPLENV